MNETIEYLQRDLLRKAKETLAAFRLLDAQATRDWFMYGWDPRKLPKPSGKTVKWQRPTSEEWDRIRAQGK